MHISYINKNMKNIYEKIMLNNIKNKKIKTILYNETIRIDIEKNITFVDAFSCVIKGIHRIYYVNLKIECVTIKNFCKLFSYFSSLNYLNVLQLQKL
jgi:hypothetical protein